MIIFFVYCRVRARATRHRSIIANHDICEALQTDSESLSQSKRGRHRLSSSSSLPLSMVVSGSVVEEHGHTLL